MSRARLRGLLPFLLLFLVLAGIVLHRVGWLTPVEGFLVRITSPVQKGVSSAVGWIENLAGTGRDLRDLRQRNETLEAENARLLLENVRLREILAEAALCRDLLGFAETHGQFDFHGARVVGRVIGRDPSNLLRTIILDVGSESGVVRNMPVVTDRGLVGRIVEASTGWSRVLLITDASSSVTALAQGTRAGGIVQGQPDGSLVMREIPQSDTVSVGDTVFTSGLGGNFPGQILIGQVVDVQRQDYDLYQSAKVMPTVDFAHLELVLVVTGFQPVASSTDRGNKP